MEGYCSAKTDCSLGFRDKHACGFHGQEHQPFDRRYEKSVPLIEIFSVVINSMGDDAARADDLGCSDTAPNSIDKKSRTKATFLPVLVDGEASDQHHR